MRIAWSTDFEGLPVTRDTAMAIEGLAKKLSAAGARVEQRELWWEKIADV